jgi:hypothetical protein
LNWLAESFAVQNQNHVERMFTSFANFAKVLAPAFRCWALRIFRVFGFERAQLMLDVGGLLTFSTLCAGGVLFVLMTATVALLRGSSYAHIILAEVIISGGAGLTMASYVMVRDINISFDQSAQRMVEADVIYKYHGRKSHTVTPVL